VLTWIALAILGFFVELNAGLDDFTVTYKGNKRNFPVAFETKTWDGKEYTPEQKRRVTDDTWRIEINVANMEWADQACRSMCGRLVIINSNDRYNKLTTELYKLSTDMPYWIGLNDKKEEGKYQWQESPDGSGIDLIEDMNLPFNKPNSHWSFLNPSQVDSWGEEEDCGQLYNWGDYTNIKATDERPIDPSDPSKQFRFNDVGCDLATVPAMPLCEKLPPGEEQDCQTVEAPKPDFDKNNEDKDKDKDKDKDEGKDEDKDKDKNKGKDKDKGKDEDKDKEIKYE